MGGVEQEEERKISGHTNGKVSKYNHYKGYNGGTRPLCVLGFSICVLRIGVVLVTLHSWPGYTFKWTDGWLSEEVGGREIGQAEVG